MKKVGLRLDDITGSIEYDPENLESFRVDFPDKSKREAIVLYLTKPRAYRVPTKQQDPQDCDRDREVKKKPTDHVSYFELALCTLEVYTGVEVMW